MAKTNLTTDNPTKSNNGGDSSVPDEPRKTPLSKWPMPWRDWFATLAEIPWASLGVIAALLGTVILFAYVKPFFPLVGDWGALLTFGIATTLAMLLVLLAFAAAFFGPTGLVAWFERTQISVIDYTIGPWELFIAQLWLVALVSMLSTWKSFVKFESVAECSIFLLGLVFLSMTVLIARLNICKKIKLKELKELDDVNSARMIGDARFRLFVVYLASGASTSVGIPVYLGMASSIPWLSGWEVVGALGFALLLAWLNAGLSGIKALRAKFILMAAIMILFFIVVPVLTNGKVTLSKGVATTLGFRSTGPKDFVVSYQNCHEIESRWLYLVEVAKRKAGQTNSDLPVATPKEKAADSPDTASSQTAHPPVFICRNAPFVSTINAQVAWSVGSRWILEFNSGFENQTEPIYLPLPLTDVLGQEAKFIPAIPPKK